jgi:hypothetical protein
VSELLFLISMVREGHIEKVTVEKNLVADSFLS